MSDDHFSTYQSKSKEGLPQKEDAKWVAELLSRFMNRQTALFQRWIQVDLPGKKETKSRLVIVTPLRLLFVRKKTFGRAVNAKFRIIDFVEMSIDDSPADVTKCQIEISNFPPELSMSRSREKKQQTNDIKTEKIILHLPKDIDREFLDIIQWCLFILTRGLPDKFKPNMNVPPQFLKQINDPVGPGQFVIDRYVAYCDAQLKNSGAGIPAREHVIEYVLNSVDEGRFDLCEAFQGDNKKIDQLQFVSIVQGLAFTQVYTKFLIKNLNIDDNSLAILMSAFETNNAIESLEFRKVDIKKRTFQALSSALSINNQNCLRELNVIDISLDRSVLSFLGTGLSYCKLVILRLTNCSLNPKATVTLFQALIKTQQFQTITHLNLSRNECGRSGTRAISSFLKKCSLLQVLVVADAGLDGNEFFTGLQFEQPYHHLTSGLSQLDCVTLIDFSGNTVGDKGSICLSQFLQHSRALNWLKLSRCKMDPAQLQRIFHSLIGNCSGLENSAKYSILKYDTDENIGKKEIDYFHKNKGKHVASVSSSVFSNMELVPKKPTQAEIMLSTNLLYISVDLSCNNLGSKGAEILCSELTMRENYTIVSLNLSKNDFRIADMAKILIHLKSLSCLERICISKNCKKGLGRKSDKEGIIGKSLVHLYTQVPTLNELSICGSEKENTYLDMGLYPFLEKLSILSNLEFLDISGNRLDDRHILKIVEQLENNSNIRLVRCNDNKLGTDCLNQYFTFLSKHPTLIDKLPVNDSKNRQKVPKKLRTIREAAKQNLKNNKLQFNIDREMLLSLTPEMRLEKELRRPAGQQFGVPLERIRGTVKYPDYNARIPAVLVRLKDLLKARNGYVSEGIFRLQPDGKEFPKIKRALNCNDMSTRFEDVNCIANAIKVWYRDLPVKVLNPVAQSAVVACRSPDDVQKVIDKIQEPFKSLFEWLLDIAVEVVNVPSNRMDYKNMAVVLCPNLYESDDMISPAALAFSQSLLTFTGLAILARQKFRESHPVKPADDMPYYKAGVVPGIGQLNDTSVPLISGNGSEDNSDSELENEPENEGGFLGSAYVNRIRGSSMAPKGGLDIPGFVRPGFEEQKELPPGSPERAVANSRASTGIKSRLAKLNLDPSRMAPGAARTIKKKPQHAQDISHDDITEAQLSKPAVVKRKRKSRKMNKALLVEDELETKSNLSAAIATEPQNNKKKKNKSKKKQANARPVGRARAPTDHNRQETRVLGGFVQIQANYAPAPKASEMKVKVKKPKHKPQPSIEVSTVALAHLDDAAKSVIYDEEEKVLSFETKPMGFQIEAENGLINVRSVRSMGTAAKMGVQVGWGIVSVNGFRDWSSMLGVLESSLGPFKISFKVPMAKQDAPISAINMFQQEVNKQQHLERGEANVIAPAAPAEIAEAAAPAISASAVQIPGPAPGPAYASPVAPGAPSGKKKKKKKPRKAKPPPPAAPSAVAVPANNHNVNEDAPVSFAPASLAVSRSEPASNINSKKINMKRNSAIMAKEVIDDFSENAHISHKYNKSLIKNSSEDVKHEFKKMSKNIKLLSNRNAQLIETLQVIRLKGEMERIELAGSSQLVEENRSLKSDVYQLQLHNKKINKQIQEQRRLMYQYANLLRKHNIKIPDTATLVEDSDDSSTDEDDPDFGNHNSNQSFAKESMDYNIRQQYAYASKDQHTSINPTLTDVAQLMNTDDEGSTTSSDSSSSSD